jgi:hypothetical protein
MRHGMFTLKAWTVVPEMGSSYVHAAASQLKHAEEEDRHYFAHLLSQ